MHPVIRIAAWVFLWPLLLTIHMAGPLGAELPRWAERLARRLD
jgi:hypothetical protein